GGIIVGGLISGVVTAVLTKPRFALRAGGRRGLADRGFSDQGLADEVNPGIPYPYRGDRARQGCASCGDTNPGIDYPYRGDRARQGQLTPQIRVRNPRYVDPSAWHNGRNKGYVGREIGPSSQYPGARGPVAATPLYGSYRGAARWTYPFTGGPPLGDQTVQSVADRQTPSRANPQLKGGFVVDSFGRQARAAIDDNPPTPVGVFPNSFYRWKESMANTIGLQTEDYFNGEVGYNLSVGNLPSGAEGNLSAPVTYQDVVPGGGVGEATPRSASRPLLGMGGGGYAAVPRNYWGQPSTQGGGGYRGQGRYVVATEVAAAYGPKVGIQSIADAQEARARRARRAYQGLSDEGFENLSDESDLRGFPWWHPHGEVGPIGNARFTLDDAGGGYVSPGAYRGARESTVLSYGYGPIDDIHTVVGRYITDYQSKVERPNVIDIQTQDFPGGEMGFNLSVGNLPSGANGNLNAPVTYQELAVAGGVAPPTEGDRGAPSLQPWLEQGVVY
ncbi:MAG TPA: hypothetical protein VMG99_01275, partial [Thermoplasmata archaeon]|nr:hypothetical protein [Thermoplasmata archaeon]